MQHVYKNSLKRWGYFVGLLRHVEEFRANRFQDLWDKSFRIFVLQIWQESTPWSLRLEEKHEIFITSKSTMKAHIDESTKLRKRCACTSMSQPDFVSKVLLIRIKFTINASLIRSGPAISTRSNRAYHIPTQPRQQKRVRLSILLALPFCVKVGA